MKLIKEWRDGLRMHSVQCMGAAASIQAAWISFPDDLKTSLPRYSPSVVSSAILFLLVLGIAGRFIDQDIKKDA